MKPYTPPVKLNLTVSFKHEDLVTFFDTYWNSINYRGMTQAKAFYQYAKLSNLTGDDKTWADLLAKMDNTDFQRAVHDRTSDAPLNRVSVFDLSN